MVLNGSGLQELHQALSEAFPSFKLLTQMVRFGLDENLETIVGSGNLSEVIFSLLTWAEAHGRLPELIQKAHQQNPRHEKLHAFVQKNRNGSVILEYLRELIAYSKIYLLPR